MTDSRIASNHTDNKNIVAEENNSNPKDTAETKQDSAEEHQSSELAENSMNTSDTGLDFEANNLDNLNNEQKEQLKSLYNKLKSSFPDTFPQWMTLGTLYRFAEGFKWDVSKAHSGMLETQAWRQECKLDTLSAETPFIASNRKLKGSYCIGQGKEGERICYICPVNNPHSFEEKRLYSIWMMEEALKAVKEPKQQTTIWLLDFSRMSGSKDEHIAKDKDRKKLSRESMKMVMNHYPETLKKMFFINPPWFFRLLWAFLSFFIEKRTYEKIQIITGSNVTPELLKYIDKDQLDIKYGGALRITDRMKENWHRLLKDGSSLHEDENEHLD